MWVSVKSRALLGFFHLPHTRDLYVEFTNGNRGVYRNVPDHVVENLAIRFSKGRYLNEAIKPNYLYEPLSKKPVMAVA